MITLILLVSNIIMSEKVRLYFFHCQVSHFSVKGVIKITIYYIGCGESPTFSCTIVFFENILGNFYLLIY